MMKFLAICNNTFTQTLRQPVYCVLIGATVFLLVMDLPLATWTMGESGGDFAETDQRMLENLGLSTLLMSGLLLAAFCASSALTREIEDRTALTVISKPVSRAAFVLGKFAGVALAIAVAYTLCTLVFLMTVRHNVISAAYEPYDFPVIVFGLSFFVAGLLAAVFGNYFFGWPFTSAAVWCSLGSLTIAMGLISVIGKGWAIVPFGAGIRPELLVGVFLTFLGVLFFVATAVAASTRLGQVATLLVCVGVFVIGSFHPYVFEVQGRDVAILRVLGFLLPNLTYFYSMDSLSSRTASGFPPQLLALSTVYCLLYVGALLALAVALFQERQLQAQRSAGGVPGGVSLLAWGGRIAALAGGLVALVRLSLPRNYSVRGFTVIAAMLIGAVAVWLLAGYFARGVRWSYRTVAALAALWLIASGASLPLVRVLGESWGVHVNPVWQVVQTGAAAVVLLLLVLPVTRRHFRPQVSSS